MPWRNPASICAQLADKISQHGVKQKLLRWYWCGVFGELYGGANETRFGMDLPDVIQWVNGGNEPRTVRDASFAPTRLLSLQSRLAAAYKGLAALLMKHGRIYFFFWSTIEIYTLALRLRRDGSGHADLARSRHRRAESHARCGPGLRATRLGCLRDTTAGASTP